jgi:hypothetical protein
MSFFISFLQVQFKFFLCMFFLPIAFFFQRSTPLLPGSESCSVCICPNRSAALATSVTPVVPDDGDLLQNERDSLP